MNSGLYATIIEYMISHDMKILFEDGIEKEGVSWRDFCGGKGIDLYHDGLRLAVEYDGEYSHRNIKKRHESKDNMCYGCQPYRCRI